MTTQERALIAQFIGIKVAFDNDLARCRHQQVNGLAMCQRKRLTSKPSDDIGLTYVFGQIGGRHESRHGLRAHGDGEFHALVFLFIRRWVLVEVLHGGNDTTHRVPVVDHEAVHALVDPAGRGVF